jgi:hypothetical protein
VSKRAKGSTGVALIESQLAKKQMRMKLLVTSRRSVKRVACADSALRLTLEFHKRCEKPRETDGRSFSSQPPTVSPTQRSPALPSADGATSRRASLSLSQGVRNRWLFVLGRNPHSMILIGYNRFLVKKIYEKASALYYIF